MLLKLLAKWAQPFLEQPYVQRTRRNHGLEHATVHMLASRIPNLQIAGRSDDSGFILMGNAPTELVEMAALEALHRMRNGEHNLALHPNCGTNLLTTASLASLVAFMGFSGGNRQRALDRLPLMITLLIGVILFSRPLGMGLQKYFTTEGNLGDLEIVDITRRQMWLPWRKHPIVIHRISTYSS